jgi:hypothetical protein
VRFLINYSILIQTSQNIRELSESRGNKSKKVSLSLNFLILTHDFFLVSRMKICQLLNWLFYMRLQLFLDFDIGLRYFIESIDKLLTQSSLVA